MNRVVTAVSGDKCVDVDVLTKHCNGCKMWKSKKGTPAHQCWLLEHECEMIKMIASGAHRVRSSHDNLTKKY